MNSLQQVTVLWTTKGICACFCTCDYLIFIQSCIFMLITRKEDDKRFFIEKGTGCR
jgi:hypothetical protein